ncbi:MAG: M48 family metallopeptidase [Capsulimonadaceae bacterium]|nr:M48 family metallopeptidase [Capsulimonadaceae bacterium]
MRLISGALGAIVAALAVLSTGCSGPIGGSYNTDQEIKLGRKVAAQVERSNKMDLDPSDNERIQAIARPIEAQAKLARPDVDYTVKIIESKEVNAFSLPGGFVYIYTGLIKAAGNDDDAIACVLGHECAHVVRRHAIKQLEQANKQGLLVDLVGIFSRSDAAYQVASLGSQLQQLHYSREDEYEADKYGLMFAYNAGFDPYGMPRFFTVLANLEKGSQATPPWASDHPVTSNRIDRVNRLIEVLRANHGKYPEDTRE